MQIASHNFLVTGGASGLGAACARRLCSRGGRVVIVDLNAPAGDALAKELGESARFVRADVADEAAVSQAIRAADSWGGLSGAVHCAGISHVGRVLAKDGPHSLADFERVIRVNLCGTFNVIRLAAEAMATREPNNEGERGAIVVTASVAAFEGQIGQAAYSASKGGVAGMVLPIARELARVGVRVVAIAPGIFHTPLMSGLPAAAQESLGKQVPFPPRLGKPDEYAQLAEQIFENPMLNGCTLRLDGALRMGPK